MRIRAVGAWAALVTVTVIASCSADHLDTAGLSGETSLPLALTPTALAPSPAAARSVAALRERFRVTPVHDGAAGGPKPPGLDGAASGPKPPPRAARKDEVSSVAVLGAGVATSFEPTGSGSVRAVVPSEAKRAALRAASVELPLRANAMARVEDDVTHLSVGFALRDAGDAELTVADGMARYPGALAGSDVVHRVHAEGTEDFVVFEARPAREELVYDVDVSRVAGLRLVSNTLEFLDEGGAPRLRVAPPYVVDARGKRSEARIAVDGCAYDTDASGPWGRPVTRAGAVRCGVRVGWSGVGYPLIVDPQWTATGSMAVARQNHTATRLPSGKVLVAGGLTNGNVAVASAELFDGSASFAATNLMTAPRGHHTATLLPSGKVLVAGGQDMNGYLKSAELFDGSASFAPTGAMTTMRAYHTATLLPSDKVLVAGGIANEAWSSAELFDGSATFSPTGTMTTKRFAHTATLLPSGKVLVAGGLTPGQANNVSLSSAELFDGNASFAPTGAMAEARGQFTATLLPSGKVLVAGGYTTAFGTVASAELFDGSTSFAVTAPMGAARGDHTATLLSSGKVLVAGGDSALTELFDGSASFAASGPLTTVRGGHTATLLPSGKVLVAGGVTTGYVYLSSAELFGLVVGTPCSAPGDCGSGVCNEKCCSAACAGACSTCDASGTCVAVKNADDPNTCAQGLNGSSCDANGVCKKVQGHTCAQGSDCVTGFCADSFCCDTPCGGACDVCAASIGTKPDGTCGTAQAGYAGAPACGAGYACDGAGTSCPLSCASDGDCLAADYCAADGTCQPHKAQGAQCNMAAGADCREANCRECATGYCVDGVCCDSACDTLCQACSAALKQSGKDDGLCGNAKAWTNPHNDLCPVDAPSTCGQNGQCNGTGACSLYYPPGTSCGASACVAGNKAAGNICNGAGLCAPNPAGVSCGEALCANGSCPATCAADANCIATAYCKQGACVPKQVNGAACTAAAQCVSGVCTDGFCCNVACAGQCQACDGATTEGTCTPVVGHPRGARTECTGAGTACDGACDGALQDKCSYPGATKPCGSSCAGDKQTLGACDGSGTCTSGAPTTCPGGFACDGTLKCRTTCAADADCAQGFGCDGGSCVPKAAATCGKDGHSVVDTEGTQTGCAPYICAGGACKTTCGSVDDCSPPNVCDASHHCTAPGASGSSGDSGGCAVAALPRGGSPSRTPALLLALGIVGLAVRRWRGDRAALPRGWNS